MFSSGLLGALPGLSSVGITASQSQMVAAPSVGFLHVAG
jgi:hypothetical protein